MSVSDPLIKELKGWTLKLMVSGTEIDDNNVSLPAFCKSLESCLTKGVIIRMDSIGFPKFPEAWYWMETIADKNDSYAYTSAVEVAKESTKVCSPTGRLRLLIRNSLTRKCLHVPVQKLIKNHHISPLELYEPKSILGDEILGEILLSVLLQCSKLNFKLDLTNASFLDETWELPKRCALEFVPCKSLGISISFVKGKALIVNLEDNSVGAEDEKIEIGDVLDEINGNVIGIKTKGKLGKIMKKAIGKPISIHIIKYRSSKSGEIYEPIAHLIQTSGIERVRLLLRGPNPNIADGPKCINTVNSSGNVTMKSGFELKYCGAVPMGSDGDVKQIENAIWRLLRSEDSQQIRVRFECLEIGIRVTQESDGEVILKHSYMEISSCGRTLNIPDYFAYIAGETNCSVATRFNAYIFYGPNEDAVQTILQSLGQGFQRTHFAV